MQTRLSHLLATLRPLLAAVALLLTGGVALAQQGAHNAPVGTIEHRVEVDNGEEPKAGVVATLDQGVVPSIVAIVVFAIVFAILAAKVWPTISKGLEDRASKIREEIAAAEAARKQAKEALEQYERSLAQARAEAQKMLEQARAQQLALANDLKAKAEAELGQLRERARKDIEAAKRAAVSEIYDKAADAATMMASKILQREVSAADQRRIMLEAVSELEALKS
jgi:F-type H+-transporting ATPase subunit b